ncbi:MAG TPA: Gfo/Idh/MocA family oxidoreductase [Candidatus Hydrogenedentes bacterium]|nr:Gfo/Idh/MocA family oxidoreductase [Candidatus Hydrogenedentota bacterium]HQM49848.1 Gfo/Idh/MocA family oxidoreductase [Candidatus Hydrogenedentota bacterium]
MKRLIQVGVGGMGAHWTGVVAASHKWQAAAYVDTNRKNLMAAAARHGMPRSRCYTSLARALREIEADALLDVTPQQFRKDVCTAAMECNLDVLCEKPLTGNLRDAKTLVSRAQRLGRILMVAQNYRYTALPQTVKRFLAQGKLGTVGSVDIGFHKGPHFGGYREKMAFPLVLDMSIHHFDLVRFLMASDVRAVQGVTLCAPWNWFKGDAGVMAALELDTGSCVNYHASWVANGWETPWNGNWRFDGSRGALLWENDELYVSNSPAKRRKLRQVAWPLVGQAGLLDAFARAVESRQQPETAAADNLKSLAVTHALVRAVREKRRVELRELLE